MWTMSNINSKRTKRLISHNPIVVFRSTKSVLFCFFYLFLSPHCRSQRKSSVYLASRKEPIRKINIRHTTAQFNLWRLAETHSLTHSYMYIAQCTTNHGHWPGQNIKKKQTNCFISLFANGWLSSSVRFMRRIKSAEALHEKIFFSLSLSLALIFEWANGALRVCTQKFQSTWIRVY